MIETGGHVSVGQVPPEVIRIIDVKCPGSGEGGTFRMENLDRAAPHDEFKLVLSSREDYLWAREFVTTRFAGRPQTVLFSPAHSRLRADELAAWILEDRLPVRFQLQLQKYIWTPEARGV
jgi:7-carboxy-7-deazaguanine synthase